ncbi:hypothetical protein [Microbacterium suwonense]|uniref:Lipoprotein n=1 Tax=Microbacterium suwonense TaxID=683047 RepID=A0ABN6X6N1_9MICO|nr:hypothetical protein [Microbacterium suwonense]BDZ39768.1 hypothetical protein GCM10025863_23820 [Microbacterium suwonense]
MTKTHASAALAGAITLGMLLSGCSGSTEPAPSDTTAATASAPAGQDSGSGDGDATGSGDTATPTADASGVAVDEIRDGTWQVGDAGEVEFTAEGGSLSLTEVRPSDGWQQRVTDEKPDEIEVHFTQGDQEWKFEVESERGTLQISKELTIRNGASGDFTIGSAATLTLTVDGSTISVADLVPGSGWSTVKQDESPDDVELDFRNDSTGGTAEFEAETGSTGVKIEISQKLRGPLG